MMLSTRLSSIAGIALLSATVLLGAASGQPAGKVLVPVAPLPEAPLSLTASDGAGLELVSLAARAVIEDPLAFTELHLVFRNPEQRVREGRFRITLPEGATVSRFAMLIGGTWQEGEVVELQAARRAYEDFLHRRQDPALLETEAGNEFSARVFPIPPGATKELIISYSQELPISGQAYRLPLRGLPKMSALRIRALVGKSEVAASASSLGGRIARNEVVEVDKRNYTPDRDFEVAVGQSRLGLRNENLVVARIAPLGMAIPSEKQQAIASMIVLFDTSASRALGYADQMAKLQALIAELAKRGNPSLAVVAFDQFVESVYTGKASGFSEDALKKLCERRALGASDLGKALAHVADLAKQGHRYQRVLLVSDGVATAGELGGDKLRPLAKSLGNAGVTRLDVLAVGGIREQAVLSGLATAGLASDGVVVDAALPMAEQIQKLLLPTRSGLKVEVAGAAWVWPTELNGVQPGDQVLVYADLPASKAFNVRVGGVEIQHGKLPLVAAERALLERAWVKARINRVMAQRESLGASDQDLGEALRKQVIELSTRYRVLCPYTALLVLETEADYARFGIERKALADILTVGPEGITVISRRDFALVPVPQPIPVGEEDSLIPTEDERPQAHRRIRDSVDKDKKVAMPKAGRPAKMSAESVSANSKVPSATMDFKQAESMPEKAEMAAPPPAPSVMPAPARMLREAPSEAAPASPAVMTKPRASRAMDREERNHEMPSQGRRARHSARPPIIARPPVNVPVAGEAPYEGEFKEVMSLLAHKENWKAMVKARDWRERDPGDVLALIAIGEAAEASNDTTLASRAYGSIIDLFPGRADLRRYAGQRLERIRDGRALALAVDTYRKAVEQRPDHPASHRLLGMALLKMGKPEEAFEALVKGVEQQYPSGRFLGADRILREDLALAATAWIRAQPGKRKQIENRLQSKTGLAPDTKPSLRFVLVWETDANDVDFHIIDGRNDHAYFGNRTLGSGGELYADVTTGYGPECFTIPLPAGARAYPYQLQAHYYSRGPMGYGMGKLQIVEHDGKGGLRFEERPFIVMVDGAYVDMGKVLAPLTIAK
jgi:tetratricopeptide (TPR) repeat protein